jgi:hypothetical protein
LDLLGHLLQQLFWTNLTRTAMRWSYFCVLIFFLTINCFLYALIRELLNIMCMRNTAFLFEQKFSSMSSAWFNRVFSKMDGLSEMEWNSKPKSWTTHDWFYILTDFFIVISPALSFLIFFSAFYICYKMYFYLFACYYNLRSRTYWFWIFSSATDHFWLSYFNSFPLFVCVCVSKS